MESSYEYHKSNEFKHKFILDPHPHQDPLFASSVSNQGIAIHFEKLKLFHFLARNVLKMYCQSNLFFLKTIFHENDVQNNDVSSNHGRSQDYFSGGNTFSKKFSKNISKNKKKFQKYSKNFKKFSKIFKNFLKKIAKNALF